MRHLPLWKPLSVLLVLVVSFLFTFPSIPGGLPQWWPEWLPRQVIQQGLDLQGGLHLLMQVEVDKAVEQVTENQVDDLRSALRKARLRYRSLERNGLDGITIALSEDTDRGAFRELLGKEAPSMQVVSDDGESTWRLTLKPDEQKEIRKLAVDQSVQTIRSRIDQFGVAEPTIQKQGEDRILLQLPGIKDVARAKELIRSTALLEFKMVDEKGDLGAALNGRVPAGDVVLYGDRIDRETGKVTKQPYLLTKRTVLSGKRLTDARVGFDNEFNEPQVHITFDRQGARKFAELTSEHVNERMAIVLDGKVHSAPVIRERIDGGRANISGNFTPEEANDLAITLRSGALPAPLTFIEERTVGPTLGSDSVREGLNSVLLGGGLVLVFMALYYKGFGMVANVAVLLNIFILMAVLAMLGATLTLPGMAGAVLLVGMSVDANVLIFERIREELRLGKTPLAAVDHGYDRAFSTILDSNLTTLITALVLYQFGTGPVRGFAVTLSIGLVASMFTAIFVTRVIIAMVLHNRRIKRLSI
ncbi:MAG: protein translocase subunit SecD [Magnetococcales bacterium]|nr:protein translocase subunit SecD [Magnetococcales bacterium]MBF0156848.1 protein translocase subunit SecD [Magnetococcales bacterium]